MAIEPNPEWPNERAGPSNSETRFRYAAVRCGDQWLRKEFDDLKSGDEFKLFEYDGTPVHGGQSIIADKDASRGAIIARLIRHP